MMETEKRVTITSSRLDGGSRYVSAWVNDAGDVIIEGQDLGSKVKENAPGVEGSEYEWTWTIRSANVARLIAALGGPSDADVLDLLVTHFSPRDGTGLEEFFQANDVTAQLWSRVGD